MGFITYRELAKETREKIDKLHYLSLRSHVIMNMSKGLRDDYEKRTISRALFAVVDSFLVYAPEVKNMLFYNSLISLKDKKNIEDLIHKLRKDYENYYCNIRDSLTAHSLKLNEIFDSIKYLNEIDQVTLEVFNESIQEISNEMLSKLGIIVEFIHIDEEIDNFLNDYISTFDDSKEGVTFSPDDLALSRPNTISIVPCHQDQEKASRIVRIIRNFLYLAKMTEISQKYTFIHNLIWSLIILDGFSLIDNIFEDKTDDPSLLTLWEKGNYKGLAIIKDFHNKRDASLEEKIRKVRNHYAAHIDKKMTLTQIGTELLDAPLVDFGKYIFSLINIFKSACKMDGRSITFAIIDEPIYGAISVAETDLIKPFE